MKRQEIISTRRSTGEWVGWLMAAGLVLGTWVDDQALGQGVQGDRPGGRKSTSRLLDDIPAPKKDRPQRTVAPGEDLGQTGDASRGKVAGLVARMQYVRERLSASDSSGTTLAAQREIVAELRRLMDEQERSQSAPKSGNSPAVSRPDRTGASGREEGADQPDSRRERESPAGEKSTEDSRSLGPVGAVERTSLLGSKEFWGQLPERVRQQIRNISPEQFLPKYERQISEYYRRLSEPHADQR